MLCTYLTGSFNAPYGKVSGFVHLTYVISYCIDREVMRLIIMCHTHLYTQKLSSFL